MSSHDHVAFIRRAQCMSCGSSSRAVITNTIYIGPEPSKRDIRRERRRARKAAKNLAMYKAFGRRPWRAFPRWQTLNVMGFQCVAIREKLDYLHNLHMEHFREPSGFKRMSQIASAYEWMRSRHPTFEGWFDNSGKGTARK